MFWFREPCGTKCLWEFNFADRRYFCILRELIFANAKDSFFELGINFCDFQKVAFICCLFGVFFITLHGNQSLYYK